MPTPNFPRNRPSHLADANQSKEEKDGVKVQPLNVRFNWRDYRYTMEFCGGVFFLLFVSGLLIGELKRGERIPLVVISLGGFRHDYIEQTKRLLGNTSLPNFDHFAALGTRAMRLVNVFPTVALSNHQTMLTGLYPQHHGVTGNTIRDDHIHSHFLSGLNDTSLIFDPWLDGWPEPIWVTAQRDHDVNTATHLWPITEREVRGLLPNHRVSRLVYNTPGDCYYPNRRRVDDIIQWLKNSKRKVDFVLAYISEADFKGHIFGPNSIQQAQTVVELDKMIGYLLEQLTSHDLGGRINVILLSDHGMGETLQNHTIVLNRIVEPNLYSAPQLSAIGYIYPNPDEFETVYDRLKNGHPHMTVYRLGEVPIEYYFNKTGCRMPPIVLVADLGWIIVKEEPNSLTSTGGQHGYPPNISEMHGFFMALGPRFYEGTTVSEAYTIDVYSLLCRLLSIPPNPNNGSLKRISKALWPFPSTKKTSLK